MNNSTGMAKVDRFDYLKHKLLDYGRIHGFLFA